MLEESQNIMVQPPRMPFRTEHVLHPSFHVVQPARTPRGLVVVPTRRPHNEGRWERLARAPLPVVVGPTRRDAGQRSDARAVGAHTCGDVWLAQRVDGVHRAERGEVRGRQGQYEDRGLHRGAGLPV